MSGRATTPIKTPREIEIMRHNGTLLASVFAMLDKWVQPGVSTLWLNNEVEQYIRDTLQAVPASLGAYDYPFSINVSPNNVACHGMPDANVYLTDTDIVNIDITLKKNDFIVDSSKMYVMPAAPAGAKHLVDIAYNAMWQGIHQIAPGTHTGDIGYATHNYALKHNCDVVKEFCGHGVGRQLHEPPQILSVGLPKHGVVLEEGMIFTVEPIINQGSARVQTLNDGWTVVTQDQQLSAQFEHTILVTSTGYEVLTLRDNETPLSQRQ
ncbi:type I methionyl aminopeptidase [Vibrio palustris]|uniref:Methionine aminopeptidase n=1 Tax=Vibrio palustris TaxID=1918946 RepID=A0A1R4B4Z5_9VIBR|nr:type I methionyl aminopeptidase [Vibrio palustris]SJL83979.1 Methionine aminopeptidase [Vibrio palustris]